jgi:hypothetical protein
LHNIAELWRNHFDRPARSGTPTIAILYSNILFAAIVRARRLLVPS